MSSAVIVFLLELLFKVETLCIHTHLKSHPLTLQGSGDVALTPVTPTVTDGVHFVLGKTGKKLIIDEAWNGSDFAVGVVRVFEYVPPLSYTLYSSVT